MNILKPLQLYFCVSPVERLLLLRWQRRGRRWSGPCLLWKLCFSLLPRSCDQQAVPWFLAGAKRMHRITGTQIRAQNQYGTGSREGPITQT